MRSSRANWKTGLALLVAGGMVSLLSGATASLPKAIWRTFEAVTVTADAAAQAAKAGPKVQSKKSAKAAGPVIVKPRLGDVTISVPTTFAAADASDGTVDGVFNVTGNLTIANGGSITCDDNGTPADACPIKINVTGNMEIQAGGSVHADNNGGNGGKGGDITITVGGNFTMRTGSGGNPAATVTAENQSGGGNAHGGKITIIVGDVTLDTSVDPAVAICGQLNGDILIETDARISSSALQSVAGDIALYAGRSITINGQVLAAGFTGGGHGGAITIQACCDLLVGDTGQIASRGRDPGADRVHLQACTVTIYGLVASQAPGHQAPTPRCVPPHSAGQGGQLDGLRRDLGGNDRH